MPSRVFENSSLRLVSTLADTFLYVVIAASFLSSLLQPVLVRRRAADVPILWLRPALFGHRVPANGMLPSSGLSRFRSARRRCKAPLLGLDAAVRGHDEGRGGFAKARQGRHRFPDLAAGRLGICGGVARAPRSDEACATAPAADERLPAGGVARGGGEERSPCHGTGGRVLGMVARLAGRSEGGRRSAGRSSTPLLSVLFTRHGLLARHAAPKASLPI